MRTHHIVTEITTLLGYLGNGGTADVTREL